MNKFAFLFFLTLVSVSTVASAENRFTGPYAGVTAGFISSTDDNFEQNPFPVPTGYTAEVSPKGALLGVVAGYNIGLSGFNNLVLGVEGDLELRSAQEKTLYVLAGAPDPQYPIAADMLGAGSIRPRVGYVFNDGQTMAFASAGISTARVKRTYYDTAIPGASSSTDWQNGWTASVGAEHFVTDNLSVQAEGRYADYGTEAVIATIYGPTAVEKQTLDEVSLRVSALFHF